MSELNWTYEARVTAPGLAGHNDMSHLPATGLNVAEAVKQLVEKCPERIPGALIDYAGGNLKGEAIRAAYYREDFPLPHETQ